jgi:segregation and condensation protein B
MQAPSTTLMTRELPGTIKSMSKRKSRRKPLTSEITSVMRAPAVEDPETAAALGLGEDTEVASDDAAAAEPAERGDAGASDADVPNRAKAKRRTSRIGRIEPTEPRQAEGTVTSALTGEPGGDELLANDIPAPTNAGSVWEDSAADEVGIPDSATVSGFPDAPQDERSELDRPSGGVQADSNGGLDPLDDEEPDVVPLPRIPNLDGEDPEDTAAFLTGLIEALLFTSQRPLPLKDLARSAGIDRPRAQELVTALALSYAPRGLCIDEVAGGFVMRSSPRYAPYIQKVLSLRPIRLSRAQLETLAIIAYRQPVTKPEVDDIRGVDSGQVIKGLLERSLLKILGKKDEPGRPMLYGTTNDFLELLNLQSLKDLPTLREYTELSDESRQKFMDETGEVAPNDDAPVPRAEAEPPAAVPVESDDTVDATLASVTSGSDGDRDVPDGDDSAALGEHADSEDGEAAVQEDLEAVVQEDLDGEGMQVIEENLQRRDAAVAAASADMGSDSESPTSISAADEEVEEEEEDEDDEDDEDDDEDEEPEEEGEGEGDLDEDDDDDDDDDDEDDEEEEEDDEEEEA